MAEIKKDRPLLARVNMRTYSEAELRDFEKKIQRFFKDYQMKNVGTELLSVLDREALSVAFGATDKFGRVILKNFKSETDSRGETTFFYDQPSRQEQLDNILNQLSVLKSKDKWVEGKKIEGLESIANNMTVDTSWEKEFENF